MGENRQPEITEEWKCIIAEYNAAMKLLWNVPDEDNWHQDKEGGLAHLFNAYTKARSATTQNHLYMARIYSMLADEMCWRMYDYELLKRYIRPAAAEYELALAEGNSPTDKELQKARSKAEYYEYKYLQESDTREIYEQQLKNITGYELLEKNGFGFHDSKPIHFEHDEKTATLKLDFVDIVATFLFEGVYEIRVDGDPLTDWIDYFYCYQPFGFTDRLFFDIGYYRILCTKVTVVDVQKTSADSNNFLQCPYQRG